jgi:hypothetical protein
MRVRAFVDGRELVGKVVPGMRPAGSRWPSKLVVEPIPAGRHTVDMDLTFSSDGHRPLHLHRSILVEVRAGRDAVVRAEVASPVEHSPEGMHLEAATRDAERLPPADLARATLDRMAANAEEVRTLLAQKRKERDVIWVMCLNDKLLQIDVALRSAGEHRMLLVDAMSSANAEETAHQLALVGALRMRVEQLLAESRQCV